MKKLFSLILLCPMIALGAAKDTKKNDDTLSLFSNKPGNTNVLDGLSVFAAYDFADEVHANGNDLKTEKSPILGAEYQVPQFMPGIAAQAGFTYDFEKTVANSDGLKYGAWSIYGEATGKVTPKIKLMIGPNYNFPHLSKAPGASIKGKLGWQFGGSYEFTNHFAVDLRYRVLAMDFTGPDQFGVVSTTGIKSQGPMLNARYMF